MKLIFEKVKTYNDPAVMDYTHELDNTFTRYFMSGKHVKNESVLSVRGGYGTIPQPDEINYRNLTFKGEPSRLTSEAISSFGVKTFPQFGGYGWYTTLYSKQTRVLAPINARVSNSRWPSYVVTIEGQNLKFVITDPDGTEYDCYRVLIRKEYLATEYVTYERTLEVPKPPNGTYEVCIRGYGARGLYSLETIPEELVVTE